MVEKIGLISLTSIKWQCGDKIERICNDLFIYSFMMRTGTEKDLVWVYESEIGINGMKL